MTGCFPLYWRVEFLSLLSTLVKPSLSVKGQSEIKEFSLEISLFDFICEVKLRNIKIIKLLVSIFAFIYKECNFYSKGHHKLLLFHFANSLFAIFHEPNTKS